MRAPATFSVTALLAAAVTSGCGKNVQTANTPGVSTQATTYTPAGCNYTVTVPPGVDTGETYYPAQTMPASTPPIHVHASFPSDPSQGFAVNWAFAPPQPYPNSYPNSTDTTSLQTEMLYGTNEAAVTSAMGAGSGVTLQWGHTARYSSSEASGNTAETRIHEVHVCGLQPATTYYYKVGNPGAFSKTYAVTTAPVVGSTSPFSFSVSGDARNNPMVFQQAQTAIQAKGASFEMFSGDVINLSLIQDEWDAFFAASDVPASLPLMTADGNHDEMSINYVEEFALPQNAMNEESPAQAGKEWYSFNYGNAHIAVLNDSVANTDTISGAEANWLDADLSAVDASKTPWQFVFHHQPEYSCDTVHGSDTQLVSSWGPIYDKHHVDIVFTGHVHNYQRSFPLNGGNTTTSTTNGTLYIVSGAVGAPQYSCQPAGSCNFSETCQQEDNFGIVQIAGGTLTFTAYNVESGAQIDTFTITK